MTVPGTLTRADLLQWLSGRPDADPDFIASLGRFIAERINAVTRDRRDDPIVVTWAGALDRDADGGSMRLRFAVAGGAGAGVSIALPIAEAKLLALAILGQDAWGAAASTNRASS